MIIRADCTAPQVTQGRCDGIYTLFTKAENYLTIILNFWKAVTKLRD